MAAKINHSRRDHGIIYSVRSPTHARPVMYILIEVFYIYSIDSNVHFRCFPSGFETVEIIIPSRFQDPKYRFSTLMLVVSIRI